jgi:hypothetical protein
MIGFVGLMVAGFFLSQGYSLLLTLFFAFSASSHLWQGEK